MANNWETLKFSVIESFKKLDHLTKEITRIASNSGRNNSESSNSSLKEIISDLKADRVHCHTKLLGLVRDMQQIVKIGDSARSAQLARFREQLAQSDREWNRQISIVETELNRQILLSGGSVSLNTSANVMLQERGSLLQSMGMIDGTIENASTANAMIRGQNEKLVSWTHKLGVITSQVPFINSLIGRINSRQFQERIILALVISVCISIFIWIRILR
jgi:hypothetical protein